MSKGNKQHTATNTPFPVFDQLTADGFLNTFIEQAGSMAEGATCDTLQSFIQKVVLSSSDLLEDSYRKQFAISGQLTREQYAELIVTLKNAIGGRFKISHQDEDEITLYTDRCPFGDLVENAPGLCHMTSSIFGGIAARNFGYAKVELKKRIALGSDHCEISIHNDPVLQQHWFDGYRAIQSLQDKTQVEGFGLLPFTKSVTTPRVLTNQPSGHCCSCLKNSVLCFANK